ncbi:unnamed protein product [Camellia sinensis]
MFSIVSELSYRKAKNHIRDNRPVIPPIIPPVIRFQPPVSLLRSISLSVVIMPRTKRAGPELGETSNPIQRQPQQQHDGYPTVDFLTYNHEQAYSTFANRLIVTWRKTLMKNLIPKFIGCNNSAYNGIPAQTSLCLQSLKRLKFTAKMNPFEQFKGSNSHIQPKEHTVTPHAKDGWRKMGCEEKKAAVHEEMKRMNNFLQTAHMQLIVCGFSTKSYNFCPFS